MCIFSQLNVLETKPWETSTHSAEDIAELHKTVKVLEEQKALHVEASKKSKELLERLLEELQCKNRLVEKSVAQLDEARDQNDKLSTKMSVVESELEEIVKAVSIF